MSNVGCLREVGRMEGCLTRLVLVDISRSGRARQQGPQLRFASLVSLSLYVCGCVYMSCRPLIDGDRARGTARRSATCLQLLRITKSLAQYPLTQSRSFGKSGNLEIRYSAVQHSINGALMEVVCGGPRTASVSCMWMWTLT